MVYYVLQNSENACIYENVNVSVYTVFLMADLRGSPVKC